MKLGLKDMKKEYKKVNLDEIEVWPFCFQSLYCFLISIFSLPLLHYTLTYTCNVRSCGKQLALVISRNVGLGGNKNNCFTKGPDINCFVVLLKGFHFNTHKENRVIFKTQCQFFRTQI